MWNKEDMRQEPALIDFSEYVRNDKWDKFIEYMMQEYNINPKFEFSKCCPYGWSISFKKASRALCRCYPQAGYFIVLVVIGQREKEKFESELDSLSLYMQELVHTTKEGMGQKWLMIEVEDDTILKDVKRCIEIRNES